MHENWQIRMYVFRQIRMHVFGGEDEIEATKR